MGILADEPDGMAWAKTGCLPIILPSLQRSVIGFHVFRADDLWWVSFKPASSSDLYSGFETAPLHIENSIQGQYEVTQE